MRLTCSDRHARSLRILYCVGHMAGEASSTRVSRCMSRGLLVPEIRAVELESDGALAGGAASSSGWEKRTLARKNLPGLARSRRLPARGTAPGSSSTPLNVLSVWFYFFQSPCAGRVVLVTCL